MTTDIVDAAAGLAADSAIAVLRRQREAFVRHTQRSHDVLIAPADPGGVSLIERAAAALRVAAIERDAALIAHYRARLHEIGADVAAIEALDVPARLAAIAASCVARRHRAGFGGVGGSRCVARCRTGPARHRHDRADRRVRELPGACGRRAARARRRRSHA